MASLIQSSIESFMEGDALSLYHVLNTLIVFLVIYLAGNAVYSLTLHPLARFPGPILPSLSRMPFWRACITGQQVKWMHKLHLQYGPVVRYSPNDLSYVDQDFSAWKAIHGHEKGGRELPKAKEWFVTPLNGVYGISSAPTHENHRRFRRVFAPAFSERALKRQEPILKRHVDLLVSKLGESAGLGQPVNMVEKYQFTTFDIMGDLTFGQPLGLLESNVYSKWVEAAFASIKAIPIAQFIQYYTVLDFIFRAVEPKFVTEMKYTHFKHSADRVDRRLQRGSEEPDIWNVVLSANPDQQLSLEEMHAHGDVFMLAGTETTGTCLSGLTYYLLSNESKLALLVREIRSKFRREDDINMESVAGLSYLNGCIKEALRLYPPVPIGVPRVVANVASGLNMPGTPVPSGTRVSVHHYATYRSPSNFRDPDTFAPERWLGDPVYQDDRRECFQPFASGPRDCIGQNMALHEMRLIIARLFFRFNLEICENNDNWDDQRAFVLWEKKPLLCRLTMVL